MSQFVAMKIAEAWKTYEEMLPDLEAMGAEVVPWKVYKRAVERNAIRLWNRSWRRDRRRPDNVPIHELVEEPAGPHPDRGHAQVEVEDLLDSLAEFVATAVRHRLDGYQVAEVAELMEVSVRTVERLLAAARGSITAEL